MGWSINPSDLASIDSNGKVTFLPHTEKNITYTVTYSDANFTCSKSCTVYKCVEPCTCANANLNVAVSSYGVNIPGSGYTTSKTIGTYNINTCLTGLTATSVDSWVTIVSVGSGNINARIQSNPSFTNSRSSAITVKGYDSEGNSCTSTFTISQSPTECTCDNANLNAAVSSGGINIPSVGYSTSTNIGTYNNSTCLTNITASPNVDWVVITSALNGNINATVSQNTSLTNDRSAVITVSGKDGNNQTCQGTFPITQQMSASTCTCESVNIGAASSGTIPGDGYSTPTLIGTYDSSICLTNITASSNVDWVVITSALNGNINATVSQNPSLTDSRDALITVSGKDAYDTTCQDSFPILQQSKSCQNPNTTYQFEPIELDCNSGPVFRPTDTYTATTTYSNCEPTIVTGTSLVVVTAVTCNSGELRIIQEGRTGATLSEAVPQITQRGGCTCCTCDDLTVTPRSSNVPSSGGVNIEIGTYSNGGCVTNLIASSNQEWVTILSFNNGTIIGNVLNNTNFTERSATITVSGTAGSNTCTKTIIISQDPPVCQESVTYTIADEYISCNELKDYIPTSFVRRTVKNVDGRCEVTENNLRVHTWFENCNGTVPIPKNTTGSEIVHTFPLYYYPSDTDIKDIFNQPCEEDGRVQLTNSDGSAVTFRLIQDYEESDGCCHNSSSKCCKYVFGTDNNECNEYIHCACDATGDENGNIVLDSYMNGAIGNVNVRSEIVTNKTIFLEWPQKYVSTTSGYTKFVGGLYVQSDMYGINIIQPNTSGKDIIIVVKHTWTDTSGLPTGEGEIDGKTLWTEPWYSAIQFKGCSSACSGGSTVGVDYCLPSVETSSVVEIGNYTKEPEYCTSEWQFDPSREITGTPFIDTTSLIFNNNKIYGRISSTNPTTDERTCQIPTTLNGIQSYFNVTQCEGSPTPSYHTFTVYSNVEGANVVFENSNGNYLGEGSINNGVLQMSFAEEQVTASISKNGCTFTTQIAVIYQDDSVVMDGNCDTPVTYCTYTVESNVEGANVSFFNEGILVANGNIIGGVCQRELPYEQITATIAKDGCTFESSESGLTCGGNAYFAGNCDSPVTYYTYTVYDSNGNAEGAYVAWWYNGTQFNTTTIVNGVSQITREDGVTVEAIVMKDGCTASYSPGSSVSANGSITVTMNCGTPPVDQCITASAPSLEYDTINHPYDEDKMYDININGTILECWTFVENTCDQHLRCSTTYSNGALHIYAENSAPGESYNGQIIFVNNSTGAEVALNLSMTWVEESPGVCSASLEFYTNLVCEAGTHAMVGSYHVNEYCNGEITLAAIGDSFITDYDLGLNGLVYVSYSTNPSQNSRSCQYVIQVRGVTVSNPATLTQAGCETPGTCSATLVLNELGCHGVSSYVPIGDY